jgi:hypothetical protein
MKETSTPTRSNVSPRKSELSAAEALLYSLSVHYRMRRGALLEEAHKYAPNVTLKTLEVGLTKLVHSRNKGVGRTKVIRFLWKGHGYYQLDKRYVYDGPTPAEED